MDKNWNTLTALTVGAVVVIALAGMALTDRDGPSTPPPAPSSPSPVTSVVTDPPSPSPSPRASRASRSRPSPTPTRRHLTVHPQRRPQAVKKAAAGNVRVITMYCDTGSRTASGKWPEPGMVAVIKGTLPFGARVHIEGMGTYTVEDYIGHGSEFDVFTHSCAEADRFGKHYRKVTVL